LALSPACVDMGRDDQSAEGAPAKARCTLLAPDARTRPQTGRARHDAEISLAPRRWRVDRERVDPRESRALRRGQRPTYALRVHAGGLRLWLQVLRERTRWLETQSQRARNCRTSPRG